MDKHRFTFVDVLEDSITLTDLRGGQWMDRVTQVCHHRFTHLLLLRDGRYLEFARLLLSKRERRLLGLLSVYLAINTIPIPC